MPSSSVSSGSILESMSTRKLVYGAAFLSALLLATFFVGAYVSPKPNNSMQFLATKCVDDKADIDSSAWFYPRGKGKCKSIPDFDSPETQALGLTADHIVFAFQMPHVIKKQQINFSRWQQLLMGVLMLDIEYQSEFEQDPRVQLLMKARLGYRNRGDGEDDWKPVDESFVHRNLDCDIDDDMKREGYYYNCSVLSLFEMGSMHHDYYLLNVRLPAVFGEDGSEIDIANKIGKLVDVHLVAIHQNGGFTQVWLGVKTLFFPLTLIELVWFWRRIRMLPRDATLLEKMLFALGNALVTLNFPWEYFTLTFDMPWLLLLNDIKQGFFYATLMIFWLVFAGEHCVNETGETGERHGIVAYWRNIAIVVFGSACLLLFDLCERGLQLRNIFDSVWATELGTNLAVTFVILAGLSAGTYFLFLCFKIYRVLMTLRSKQSAISAMSSVRRIHYQGLLWRFNFLILGTVVTAAFTAVGFILGKWSEGQYKWDEEISLEYNAGFMIFVYGLWNTYIMAVVFLYAPSHKNWPSTNPGPGENDDTISNGEEIEFSIRGGRQDTSEISSLTAFMRHQAQD